MPDEQQGLPEDRPSRSARDLAREAARAAVGSEQEQELQEPPRLRTTSPDQGKFEELKPAAERRAAEEQQAGEQEDHEAEVDITGEEVESVEEVAAELEEEAIWKPEDFAHLADRGIDLPVSPEDVPENFQEGYAKMAQALEHAYESLEQTAEARQMAEGRIEAFAERMQSPEGQKRILLTLALGNQDVFNEAVEMFQRMNQDPEFASMVRNQIENEIREEQLNLRERAMTQSRQQTYAQQVESRTTRLAKRVGVDVDLAKEMVIARLRANRDASPDGKANITLKEVDEVITGLARRLGSRARPKPRKDPKTVQRETHAPTTPTEGAGKDAPAQESQQPRTPSKGESQSIQDLVRGAVRQSIQNTRSKGL